MPRTLKRRSDAISRDTFPSPRPSPEPEQTQRTNNRRRQPSASSSEEDIASADASADVSDAEDVTATQSANTHRILVKKLVRLALACEYSRLPLRRAEISQKVFKDSGASGRSFKSVFSDSQRCLEGVFGMRLVVMPERERVGLRERRVAATQAQASQRKAKGKGKQKEGEEEGKGGEGGGGGGQGKSWILVSTLPEGYKHNNEIVTPNKAPSESTEAGYTALYTFVVALVYLNANELSEGKMERYMDKVNVSAATEWGSWEKVLARMVREGYVDRRREEGEGWVYNVGPRGKVEVGAKGVEGLVKSVYGVFGGDENGGKEEEAEGEETEGNARVKVDEDDLNKRLTRSLGFSVGGQRRDAEMVEDGREEGEEQAPEPQPQPQQRRRRGRRRNARNDDDDDDDDE